ncbi:MAG: hypothetical protein VYC63_03870 [Verrucomicrobiota bacterium]|nr:hypothetical protein [Verrucomicrobiota bacterium]
MPESSVTSLRRGFKTRQIPESCSLIIFGATGDLTHRKLIPALYNLSLNNELPEILRIIGFARRDKTDQSWQEELEKSNSENSRSGHDGKAWDKFATSFSYHRGDLNDPESYKTLSEHLDEIESEKDVNHNRLFYLSTAPQFFPVVLENLKAAGLNNANTNAWSRIIIEKPFGSDLKSAQDLNQAVNETFSETDTYRIDHYLGK